MNETSDFIHIEELELFARVGVTSQERAKPQRLTASMTLWPLRGPFAEMSDDLARTIDYAAVVDAIARMISAHESKLIETLAGAIAELVLRDFPVCRVRVELRKFILPAVKYVGVEVTRRR